MARNGAIFGVVSGSLLSLTGNMLGGLVEYMVGRYCQPLLNKVIHEKEQLQAQRFMKRWGMFSVVISRPIPLLAETVVICAGVTQLNIKNFLASLFVGSISICFVYAITGAYATTLKAGLISFVVVILLSLVFWYIRPKNILNG